MKFAFLCFFLFLLPALTLAQSSDLAPVERITVRQLPTLPQPSGVI